MPAETKIGKTLLRLVTGHIAEQDTDAVVTAAHWRLNKGAGQLLSGAREALRLQAIHQRVRFAHQTQLAMRLCAQFPSDSPNDDEAW